MLKNTCFLLVDDDCDDVMVFGEVLAEEAPAITFHSAAGGLDALKLLKEGLMPDVIFLDLNMPGMDGKECLAELKKSAKHKDVPVIIYTTSSLARDIEYTMQHGAAGFITKPDNMQELRLIINSIAVSVKHNNVQKNLRALSERANTFIVC